MISQEYLKSILHYDAWTGLFTWLVDRRYIKCKGRVAGGLNNGYLRVCIDGKIYFLNRLAWLYMTGELPKDNEMVDHKNAIKTDNSWINLRKTTPSQNQMNIGKRINNTSGHKGVYFEKRSNKWMAQIRIEGKKKTLGLFKTLNEASSAYRSAAIEHHREYAKF